MRPLLLLLMITIFAAACSAEPTAPTPEPTTVPEPTAVPTEAPANPQVEVIEDVLYATAIDDEAEDQTLDVAYLSGSSEKKPIIIWAHGNEGSSDKSRTAFEARDLAEDGFVVLSIDYNPTNNVMNGMSGTAAKASRGEAELDGPLAIFREMVEDGECALRYAAETAEQYGGDPEQIIWAGFRNGAGLGALLALGEGDIQAALEEYAAESSGPQARVTCTAAAEPASITGLVASGGMFPGNYWLENDRLPWWTAVFAPMASYAALGNNPDLTVKVIHPPRDAEVMYAYDDAVTFAAALQEAGYDAEFVEGTGSGPLPELMVEQIRAVGNQ